MVETILWHKNCSPIGTTSVSIEATCPLLGELQITPKGVDTEYEKNAFQGLGPLTWRLIKEQCLWGRWPYSITRDTETSHMHQMCVQRPGDSRVGAEGFWDFCCLLPSYPIKQLKIFSMRLVKADTTQTSLRLQIFLPKCFFLPIPSFCLPHPLAYCIPGLDWLRIISMEIIHSWSSNGPVFFGFLPSTTQFTAVRIHISKAVPSYALGTYQNLIGIKWIIFVPLK